MKMPSFVFTCTSCRGETMIDFHHITFTRTYSCTDCSKPFRISKRQGWSISKQLEDFASTMPDDEITIH